MTRIKGIDISRAQGAFDLKKAVDEGTRFVIIRAGIRTDEDTYFRRNVSQCERLSVPYGLYWFFEARSMERFSEELNACIEAIKGTKPLYPVFIDMETGAQMDDLTNEQRTSMAVSFCERIKENGFPAGIYANPNWLENYYNKEDIVGKYDIWLAHWTGGPDIPSRFDYGQKMWQWGSEYIGGTEVDGDISFTDYPEINKNIYEGKDEDEGENNPDYPDYREGDKITVMNAPLYISATATEKSNTVSGDYWIWSPRIINGRIRITTPKNNTDVTGWVNVTDIRKAEEKPPYKPYIKVGDTVMVKPGATTYFGTPLAPFVYSIPFKVLQAGTRSYPDYIVIGIDGDVTAAVKESELIVIDD